MRERRLQIDQINAELVGATECAEDEIKHGRAGGADVRLETAIVAAEKMRIKSAAAIHAREVLQRIRTPMRRPELAKPVARAAAAPKSGGTRSARPVVLGTQRSPPHERLRQPALATPTGVER